jgi:acyl-CoA thioesterase-1
VTGPCARRLLVVFLLVLLASGCGSEPKAGTATAAPSATTAPPISGPRADAPADGPTVAPGAGAAGAATTGPDLPVVVFLGDSLTAGLGLAAEQAYPALVSQRLAVEGTPIQAVNAGVSGDTSAGGLRRLGWLLRQQPDLMVVELGANDALRGQPLAAVEENLRLIVEQSQRAGVQVLLVGLRIPPSYGSDYAEGFAALYPRLARELDVPLVPFLLEGVAGDPELNLPDGIHPNAEGHRRIAELVAPRVAALLGDPERSALTARPAGA